MIGKFYRRIKKMILLLTVALLLTNLTGCRTVQEKILDNLEEAYGTEFEIASFRRVGAVYEPICYPIDDPSLSFEGVFDKDGNILMDGYIGSIINNYDMNLFTQEIGSDMGEFFIHGGNYFVLDSKDDDCNELYRLIRSNDFSINQVFDIRVKHNASYSASSYFLIFINISADSYNMDYGNEYDCIERATGAIISRYKNEYGIKNSVDIHIILLEEKDYKETLANYLNSNHQDLSYSNSRSLVFAPSILADDFDYDYILSREEYLIEREKLDE